MSNNPKTKATGEEVMPEGRPRKEPPPPRYAPNIIPLIDVLFMLLLYFLLSTRFRQMEGDIPGSLPASAGTETTGPLEKEVYIKVIPRGEDNISAVYEISRGNLQCESAFSLFENLKKFQKDFGQEAPVLIEPTGGVRWKYVVTAFNEAVRAKFNNIGFIAPT